MKILSIICNVVLLGFLFLAFILDSDPGETASSLIAFLLFLALIFNIVFLLGSRVGFGKVEQSQSETDHTGSVYPSIRIAAIILNVILIATACWVVIEKYSHIRGSLAYFLVMFLMLTPLISLIAAIFSRSDKFRDLKRTLKTVSIILGVTFTSFFLTMYIWIGLGIRERISNVKQQYPGTAEDALLAYLADSTHHTPRERTDVAVWTLGQIRSQKALPVLKALYRNDPEGKSCHHNTELCQYELHKAIISIEHGWLGHKEKNWFGSWSWLNK